MIEQLMVKNYILFDHALIDFSTGMSVITGETGAGKSLLIDAIGYLCGKRCTSNIVRKGKDKATLQMVLSCEDPTLRQYLEENDFDVEDELIITRTITTNQKSTIRINQQVTTLGFVRHLMTQLIDIHSQMDTYQLIKPETQLAVLDGYAHTDALRKQVSVVYHTYKEQKDAYDSLVNETLSDDELDFVTNQYNQICEADVQPEELDTLLAQIKQKEDALRNQEMYMESLRSLEEEQGILDRLYALFKSLQKSDAMQEQADQIRDMYYQLDDIKETLHQQIEGTDDSVSLDDLQARVYTIRGLYQRYGGSYESLMEKKTELEQQIDRILHRETVLEQSKANLEKAEKEYVTLAQKLSKQRKACFAELESKVMSHCKDLMLEHCQFQIKQETKPYAEDGIDTIAFYVSMNPGQPFVPLKDSASGGELSRLMLALKVVFQTQKGIETIIFDEIDTGVSGRVAYAMGQKMHTIAKSYQVLCITHLASVAAWADTHYCVRKSSQKDSTFTSIEELDEESSLIELATMSAGKPTPAAIQAAKELKERVSHG